MGGLGPFSGSIWRYFLLGGFSGSKREVCPRRAASGALEVTSLASQLGFLAWLPSGASGALEVTSLASRLGFPTEFMFGVDASIIYIRFDTILITWPWPPQALTTHPPGGAGWI